MKQRRRTDSIELSKLISTGFSHHCRPPSFINHVPICVQQLHTAGGVIRSFYGRSFCTMSTLVSRCVQGGVVIFVSQFSLNVVSIWCKQWLGNSNSLISGLVPPPSTEAPPQPRRRPGRCHCESVFYTYVRILAWKDDGRNDSSKFGRDVMHAVIHNPARTH